MMKRIVLVLTMLIMLGNFVFASDIFPDLKWIKLDEKGKQMKDKDTGEFIYEEHWACKDIKKAYRIGLINGHEDGTFKPENSVTRAEFIKMVMILATNSTFNFEILPSVVDDKIFGKYITVAEMQDVIDKGQYTLENMYEPISRIEMVCILSRIQINMKKVPQSRDGKLPYTDIDSLTNDEKGYLLHAAKYGLMKDMLETTTFKPNQNLTRAEATVAIMRIY